MDNEGKCGLLLITWVIITGVCLFTGAYVAWLFVTLIAGVITYANEMTDRERKRGDRYRARFLHENRREQK